MSHPAITVDNLSKAYRIGVQTERADSFVGALQNAAAAPWRNWNRLRKLNTYGHHADAADLHWALRDVSFEVPEGEVLGVIGRNGAGKSTLLKILSRITEPTRGRATIRGRVSSLLEVGTGFHPELSGRENIYLNGTILGMRKREIDRKLDQIIDFSGVEKFLDTPIKRYSSGMKVRLAFAVAAHLEPEILIIDEVLAVGDAEFQKKCLGKMHDVARGGRTVLFVSHNMAAVESLCSRAIELHHGRLEAKGETISIVSQYRRRVFDAAEEQKDSKWQDAKWLEQADLVDDRGQSTRYLRLAEDFNLRITINPISILRRPLVGVGIDSVGGERLLTVHSPIEAAIGEINSRCILYCCIPKFPLAPGSYTLKLVLSDSGRELECVEQAVPFSVVDAEAFGDGRTAQRGLCVARSNWTRTSVVHE